MAEFGSGATLKVTLPAAGSLVEVLDLDSITPPDPQRSYVEYFPLDGSPDIPTVKRGRLQLGSFTFTGRVSFAITASATIWQLLMDERDRLVTDSAADTALPCEITANTALTTDVKFAFSAFVESVSLSEEDGLQIGTVTMKVVTIPIVTDPV